MKKLSLNQFDYQLPKKLIAQKPAEPRDHSRLLKLQLNNQHITHHHFYDLSNWLKAGDILVRNSSKVIPARLIGQKDTGGKIEVLLSKPLDRDHTTWLCLTKPGVNHPTKISFPHSNLVATIRPNDFKTNYLRHLDFSGVKNIKMALTKVGLTPLPPYICATNTESQLRKSYQTTFAKTPGSVAAPTAGLHFTKNLDLKLKAQGVEIVELTLHVGLGTFLPVKNQDITTHSMHSEWFKLEEKTAQKLNLAKKNGQRIIAVGTTSVRVLESCLNQNGQFEAQTGETKIYIYPPYKFRAIDGLITNFHLPKSTLLMLVSAFVSAPNTKEKFQDFKKSSLGLSYEMAIKKDYRFYSFGDSMLILK